MSSEHLQEKDLNIPAEAYDSFKGVAGDLKAEKDAKFYRLQNEKVICKQNSFIVLGRDRPSSPLSGYGGRGREKSNSIDIVVGRQSVISEEVSKQPNVWSNPDFKNDAARIHISQRTDVDKNFDIPEGKIGISQDKSAIGLKADNIRVIARSGIKLVSSVDSKDSHGRQDPAKLGIDLIAGVPFDKNNPDRNNQLGLVEGKDDMQPIPKGANLVKAFNHLSRQLDSITGIISTFVRMQMEFNNYVTLHTHIENFYGLPGYPSKDLPGPNINMNIDIMEETLRDIMEYKSIWLNEFRNTFLSTSSAYYINSKYHHLN